MIKSLISKTIIIVALSVSMSTAVDRRPHARQESLDHFCDKILRHLTDSIRNRSEEFITIPGFGPYGSGVFSGLNTIKRFGHATAKVSNRTVAMTATLGDRTRLSYPCHISVFRRNVCVKGLDLYFKGLRTYFTFRVRTEDGIPQLDVCDVSNLGKVTVRREGRSFNPIVQWMGSWLVLLIRSRIERNLEDALCNVVASNL